MSKTKVRILLIAFLVATITIIGTGISVNVAEEDNSLKIVSDNDMKALGSASNYTIQVNKRYTSQYKFGSNHILKYKFTLPEGGVVTPKVYIDEKTGNNCIGWADYV